LKNKELFFSLCPLLASIVAPLVACPATKKEPAQGRL